MGESSDSDSETSVVISLPGSELDAAVNSLRRYPNATDVDVDIDVEPEQVAAAPLGSDPSSPTPKPVRLEVTIERASRTGPWVTIVGAVLVAGMAMAAIAFVQRRYGSGVGDGSDPSDPTDPPTTPGSDNAWI